MLIAHPPTHPPRLVSLQHTSHVPSAPCFSGIWGSAQYGSFLPVCLYLPLWYSILFAPSELCFHYTENSSLLSSFYLQWCQTHDSDKPIFSCDAVSLSVLWLSPDAVSFNPSPPPTHNSLCPPPLAPGPKTLLGSLMPFLGAFDTVCLWIHPVALSSLPYLPVLFIISSLSFLYSSES